MAGAAPSWLLTAFPGQGMSLELWSLPGLQALINTRGFPWEPFPAPGASRECSLCFQPGLCTQLLWGPRNFKLKVSQLFLGGFSAFQKPWQVSAQLWVAQSCWN